MIYYLQEHKKRTAPIKIGYTDRDPQQRLAEFQTGYGQPKYSRWLKSEWEEDVWKATTTRPPCVSGRTVPDWLVKKEP